MPPSIPPNLALGAYLAQAAPIAPMLAVAGLGVAGFLAWQLWRARRTYAEELSEQSNQALEAQEKVRQALQEKEALAGDNQAKSEMLATLSREIRAHLNGVVGSADLLLDNSVKPQQRELLTTLRSSAEALHQSLNDVLEYSSIESGQIPIAKTRFDLMQPLVDAVEALSLKASLKNLELVLIVAPEVPLQVIGDAARLRQALTNLISNAVRFTPRGRVVVRVDLHKGSAAPSRQGGGWLHFSISDTGPGIPEELQATIFNRVAQSDSPSPRKFGGSGLELAISKKLVELMGGQIGARNLPESGSEFWVVLPLPAEATRSSFRPFGLDGLHVVVLDDLAAARVAASAMLSRMGVDHDVTDTGIKAAELFRDAIEAGARDLVLLLDESIAKDSVDVVTRMFVGHSPLQATRIVLMSRNPEEVSLSTIPFPIAAVVRKPLLRPESLADSISKTPPKKTSSGAPFEFGAGTHPRQGPLVLVVDDDEISRSVSSQLLARLNCVVELAASGVEAIERAQRTNFDLVFMDCQMPEMDGFTTTEKIRAATGNRPPPIVALTANITVRDRERCFAVGMCDFVSKPARLAELARAVKTWIPKERFVAK